ncbi:tetratricopeptide repeat protein (macronuclear) [Tetrahymena thermophila SB210]|uniref:Tetratricopeptide repeat protein n=1 Tax=Tetrahymena thermophila (strain SB210) TaxID=312017 RepID=Q24C46_TETTS|nr:tetratricopeptide repeat protein [Tetrahymena thermophila SB210]EAS05392.2 tetratricopeptide repeat protein [Tetrahymena thermophila SB210]|eukprot:XP_001025637.2 tetratricopeptide repeat protein [Tetrahymena thermophila SB210]
MSTHSALVQNFKDLYNKCKLIEVLKLIDDFPVLDDFDIYSEVQMFKSICLFELSRFDEGTMVMENLLNRQKKERQGKQIQEIDIIVRILLLWQLYFSDQENLKRVYEFTDQLYEICKKYSLQFSDIKYYNHGIYQFGIGTCSFFEYYYEIDNLECVDYFIKCIDQVPQYEYQILNSIGWIYIMKNKYEESLKWNKRLYEKCPSFPGVANNLSVCYMNMEMYEEAKECIHYAEKLCPSNVVILNNVAQIYELTKDLQNATKYHKMSYQLNPKFSQTCYQYGLFMIDNGFEKEAIQILEKGLNENPDCYMIYEQLVQLLYEKEDYEKCLQYLEKGIQLNPNDPRFYVSTGSFYFNSAEYGHAIKNLKNALVILENKKWTSLKIEAMAYLGSCYFYLEQYEEALNYYFQAINQDIKSYDFRVEIKNIALILDFQLICKGSQFNSISKGNIASSNILK